MLINFWIWGSKVADPDYYLPDPIIEKKMSKYFQSYKLSMDSVSGSVDRIRNRPFMNQITDPPKMHGIGSSTVGRQGSESIKEMEFFLIQIFSRVGSRS